MNKIFLKFKNLFVRKQEELKAEEIKITTFNDIDFNYINKLLIKTDNEHLIDFTKFYINQLKELEHVKIKEVNPTFEPVNFQDFEHKLVIRDILFSNKTDKTDKLINAWLTILHKLDKADKKNITDYKKNKIRDLKQKFHFNHL